MQQSKLPARVRKDKCMGIYRPPQLWIGQGRTRCQGGGVRSASHRSVLLERHVGAGNIREGIFFPIAATIMLILVIRRDICTTVRVEMNNTIIMRRRQGRKLGGARHEDKSPIRAANSVSATGDARAHRKVQQHCSLGNKVGKKAFPSMHLRAPLVRQPNWANAMSVGRQVCVSRRRHNCVQEAGNRIGAASCISAQEQERSMRTFGLLSPSLAFRLGI